MTNTEHLRGGFEKYDGSYSLEGLRNTFMPQFTNNADSATMPDNKEGIKELASLSYNFLKDYASFVKKGFSLEIKTGYVLSFDDTCNLFAESVLERISNLALIGNYTNPTSDECKLFYHSMNVLSENNTDLSSYITKYESCSGYPYNKHLFNIYRCLE